MNAAVVDAPERVTLDLSDGGMSYLTWPSTGQADCTLLFLHANGFNGLTYRKILDGVAGHCRVIAPDFRGHGSTTLSAEPSALKGWTQYRDDIVCLLEDVKTDRPVVLAGHSLGGSTAALVAAIRPDLVARLVLFEPVMFPAGMHRFFKVLRHLGLRRFDNPLALGAEKRRQHFPTRQSIFESYHERGAFAGWPDDMLWDYIDGGTRELADGTIELCCSGAWEAANYRMAGFPIMETFARIPCPVRLIRAQINSSSPEFVISRLTRRFSNVDCRSIPDRGHFLPMQEWQLAQRELLRAVECVT